MNNNIKKRRNWQVFALILSLSMLASCSNRQPSFAESIAKMDMGKAVELSKIHIDSIIGYHPEVLKSEVREICKVLNRRGEQAAAIEIVAYTYGIDPGNDPDKAKRFLTSTLLPGMKAPDIIVMNASVNERTVSTRVISPESDGMPTILLFYESHCDKCRGMVDSLISRYNDLRKADVRVITISADTDKELYEEYSGRFPWPDKVCHFRYFDGLNFINYGVYSTPTLFFIDRKGIVAGQYETIDQVYDIVLK